MLGFQANTKEVFWMSESMTGPTGGDGFSENAHKIHFLYAFEKKSQQQKKIKVLKIHDVYWKRFHEMALLQTK